MTKINSASLCLSSSAVKRCFALLAFSFICYSTSYCQLNELEVNSDIESGILIAIDPDHDLGLIQFKINNYTDNTSNILIRELSKYEGDIDGMGFSAVDQKVIVSYRESTDPNFILAILDRVNIRAFYENNGEDVYYVKDGRSAFIR